MTSETDERLTALEIKASFTEDLLDKLEHIVVQQHAALDSLNEQVRELARRLQDMDSSGRGGVNVDRPPHY